MNWLEWSRRWRNVVAGFLVLSHFSRSPTKKTMRQKFHLLVLFFLCVLVSTLKVKLYMGGLN
jgi:hypothetical protein